ncbi:MAG: hypothetical protein KC543_14715 [Myxococcales bacterium]|nr:hypothetical protein [Myxococcales bacterium]
MRLKALAAALIAWGSSALAFAQDAGAETAAQSRSTQFVAVRGPQTEHVPGGALLIIAYGIVFVLLLLYVLRLFRLQAKTDETLAQLGERIDRADRAGADGAAEAKRAERG